MIVRVPKNEAGQQFVKALAEKYPLLTMTEVGGHIELTANQELRIKVSRPWPWGDRGKWGGDIMWWASDIVQSTKGAVMKIEGDAVVLSPKGIAQFDPRTANKQAHPVKAVK